MGSLNPPAPGQPDGGWQPSLHCLPQKVGYAMRTLLLLRKDERGRLRQVFDPKAIAIELPPEQ